MFVKTLLPAIILLGTAMPAVAKDSSQPSEKVEKHKEKKVCRRNVSTGSFLPKRECHTKAEWEAMAESGRDDIDRARTVDSDRWRGTGGAATGD